VYGRAKYAVAYNYLGQRAGRPHLASWAEAGLPLAADLLAGDQDVRPRCSDLLRRALKGLPAAVCARPRVRADAGYFSAELAHAADAAGVDWAIAAKRNIVVAPIHRAVTGGLDEEYGDLVSLGVYRVALNAYLTYVLVDIVRLCRRYADLRDDAGRSAGLTFVGWGCDVGLGYSLCRLAYAVLDPVLPGQPLRLLTIGRWSALISLAALAVGVLTPWWLPSALAWRDARRGTAQVGELWSDLAAAFPTIVLRTGPSWTASRAQLRYDRCLIEIAEELAKASLGHEFPFESTEGDHINGLAVALRRSRGVWTTGVGPKAATTLPTLVTPASEQRLLLDLASAYSLAGSQRDPQGAGAC